MISHDVTGLEDSTEKPQFDHTTFKGQIVWNENGYYETTLPWKHGVFKLTKNNEISKVRLISTATWVLSEQTKIGILQPVPQHLTVNLVHFVPHYPVKEKEAEATNGWIV